MAMTGLTRTSLKVAVATTDERVISVISATGFLAGYGCYIDREYMSITKVDGTLISVRRGAGGTRATPHLKGANVFVATPNLFTTYDRAGAGTAADQLAVPYINIMNGNVWQVVGSVWVKGNTYGSSTGYGLSPAIWADCPLQEMAFDPSYGSTAGDDFMGSSIVTTAHGYVWAGANGTVTTVAAVPHGAWILTATGADNDEAYLTTNNNLAGLIKAEAASTWWYETRVKIKQITLAQGMFIGLAEETGAAAADCITDNDMILKVMDSIGFNILTATDIAPYWRTVHQLSGGAVAVVHATEGGLCGIVYVKLGMKSVAGTVTFYIDGVPLATTVLSSATNFPLDQIMQPSWWVKTGQGTSNLLTIDWWRVAQTRIAN
jgi:hypothetical protein